MATDFPHFASLPPELRLRIWHFAPAASWFCTILIPYRPKAVDTHPRKAISQTCVEARQALAKTYTYIEGLGWFKFVQYLLLVRDHVHGPCVV